ncbi:MAG: adenylate/guanylate cyclase [Gammaproteobacteria bacterium]|nr:MAG: adenylate/guanylate cyclase [Gammaproteobacteria bacterium]
MNEFQSMLNDFFHLNCEDKKSLIEEKIWSEYGVHGYIMIMDMSDFSLVTQRYGIVYYLAMIEKMRTVVAPVIKAHSGHLVKFVADNVFASFDQAQQVLDAALEINETLAALNKSTPKHWDICISTGIDYGRFLRTKDGDIYGDAVNCASKFGEDIAQKGEIIMSKRAFLNLEHRADYDAEFVRFKISGISLEAYSINHKHLG